MRRVRPEGAKYIRQYAPTGRSYGRFLSRLVYEHVARVEERARVKETLYAALQDDGDSLVK